MKDVMLINRLEQIKVISDINKVAIIDCLSLGDPMTITQISEKIGMPYSKVSYNIKKLESLGMVEVVDINVKFGIQEKYYAVTAKEYRIDRNKISVEDPDQKEEYEKELKEIYKILFKSINKEYFKWVDSIKMGEEVRSQNFFRTIYLDDNEFEKLKNELQNYFYNLFELYNKKESKQSKPYTLASLIFEKK